MGNVGKHLLLQIAKHLLSHMEDFDQGIGTILMAFHGHVQPFVTRV
jgi:hypothetical protein